MKKNKTNGKIANILRYFDYLCQRQLIFYAILSMISIMGHKPSHKCTHFQSLSQSTSIILLLLFRMISNFIGDIAVLLCYVLFCLCVSFFFSALIRFALFLSIGWSAYYVVFFFATDIITSVFRWIDGLVCAHIRKTQNTPQNQSMIRLHKLSGTALLFNNDNEMVINEPRFRYTDHESETVFLRNKTRLNISGCTVARTHQMEQSAKKFQTNNNNKWAQPHTQRVREATESTHIHISMCRSHLNQLEFRINESEKQRQQQQQQHNNNEIHH